MGTKPLPLLGHSLTSAPRERTELPASFIRGVLPPPHSSAAGTAAEFAFHGTLLRSNGFSLFISPGVLNPL